jgi:rhomboid protease GluP
MIATIILVSIIALMFVLDTFIFVPKGTKIFTKEHLLAGDKVGYITKALKLDYTKIIKGQVWRLFTQVFLHVGIFHIAFNSLALLIVGYALETTIGWQKTILGFFFSAFFSGLIMAFGLKFEDGEGASTGIYGLIAMYIMVAIKEHNLLFSNLSWIFVAILGIYTVVGMLLSKIDRWEHSTGFIGGIIYSVFILHLISTL